MLNRFMFCLAASLCLAGCVGRGSEATAEKVEVAGAKETEVFPPESEAPARALAEKLARGLAEAIRSGDFAAFHAAQPKGGKELSADMFEQMRQALTQRYGKLVGTEYMGRLDQGRVMDFLWKFTFEQPKESGASSRHEIIYWVRTGMADGKPVVAGFSFNFF